MIIAAIAIGLLTAYYFGLQAGGYAAAAAAVLFVVAFLIPGWRLYAYGLVAVGVVGVAMIGPKQQKKGAPQQLVRWVRSAAYKLYRRSKQ